MATGMYLARALWCPGPGRIFALAAGLGASEWLRGIVFSGFPWNSLGMAFGGNLILGQAASILGLHGLTFVAIALCAAPATLADAPAKARRGPVRSIACSASGLAAAVLVSIVVFGNLRLASGTTEFDTGVRIRVVQPNVRQDSKFRPENKDLILGQYLSLSDRATSPSRSGLADVTHLIWPESPFPFILSQDVQALGRIGAALGKTTLITGAARAEARPGRSGSSYFNSVQVISDRGTITDTYDKAHLVPFGEYLPAASLMELLGLRQLVQIPGGFEAAAFRKGVVAPGLPLMSVLICYEAIFPGQATPNDGKSARPGLIVNVTNDGWFGRSTGPYQHLAQARLRSIEEGLPLIRSANTGISAVVDPYGRILDSLPLGVEGVLDTALPKPIEPPLFSRYPLWTFGVMQILMILLASSFRIRRPFSG
jgi:apolipoprotein N-acyltransferase